MSLPISKALVEALDSLNAQELAFVAGYAWARAGAGLEKSASAPIPQALVASNESVAALTPLILSASQTGNAKALAKALHSKLSATGIAAKLVSVADYKAKDLSKEALVLLVTSTQGDGEPPEEAISFYKALFAKKAPDLHGVKFAVLGLGDRSYPDFSQAAKDFDAQFAALGGERLLARVDCDLDYQAASDAWMGEVLSTLQTLTPNAATKVAVSVATPAAGTFNKACPYSASLLTRQKITARGASKDVEHIEIDLEGADIHYQPGDALGVWYENAPAVVDEILALNGLSGEENVTLNEATLPLREALTSKLDITTSTPPLAEKYAELSGNSALRAVLDDRDKKTAFLAVNPPIALFADYSAKLAAQTLADLFRPLTPRLYSIASSQAEVGEEVHLTVGVVRYAHHGNTYTGGASGFLGATLALDGEVKVYIEENSRFHLPAGDVPILMIGAGTGIAPYRAFMQQREAENASGENWLVFGNTKFTDDFLYQAEWLKWREKGLLTRADLAWSRDTAEKVYVQHKLLAAGAAVWDYVQGGAVIYVCGDASKMAKDVQAALLTIAQTHGKLDADAAEAWLDDLREAGRYLRDVY